MIRSAESPEFLLIAWGFGHFMEGMAGFGTAVAIPAGILIALGMEPIPVVVGCLVVNSMPTAFGSVGVPIATISAITGLSPFEIAANTAKIEVLIFFMLPFFLVFIFFGPMQVQTAKAIGADPSWLIAANTCGAGIGKMISPQGIAIGAASAGLSGSESKLMASVMKYCILFVVIAGVLSYFLQ